MKMKFIKQKAHNTKKNLKSTQFVYLIPNLFNIWSVDGWML